MVVMGPTALAALAALFFTVSLFSVGAAIVDASRRVVDAHGHIGFAWRYLVWTAVSLFMGIWITTAAIHGTTP